jgi:hypothetical protein
MAESRPRVGLPVEVVAVWAMLAVVAVEVLVTYSRLPADELYHVSGGGLGGGAGRLLVLVNFPVAVATIGVLAVLAGRVPRLGVAAGIAPCAVVAWPGVVEEADLDAKWINAVPALGVAVALAASVRLWRAGGIERAGRCDGDRARVAVVIVAALLSVPWLLAESGASLDGVPVLGSLWQTGELRTQPGDPVPHPAVHHGHHHGMDGTLLLVTALLLSRVLPRLRGKRARAAAGGYLALMAAYGAGNLANDFWLEQVVKRGWTDRQIPDVTVPELSVAWGVIVAAAAAAWAVGARRTRRRRATRRRPPMLDR